MSMRAARYVLGSFGILLILLLLLVALLPALASTGPIRRMVLSRVNEATGGDLKVEGWSLGWFSGVRMEGIDYSDRAGNTRVQVARVSAPVKVLGLLGTTKDLGHIEIDRPNVTLALAEAGPARTVPAAGGEAPAKAPAAARAEAPKKKPLPEIKLKFDLREGNFRVRMAKLEKPLEITGLNVSLDVPSLNGPATFQIKSGFGEAGGGIDVKGKAKVMTRGEFDPEGLAADGTIVLDRFPLGTALTVARAFSTNVPETAGTLDTEIGFKVAGLRKVEARGSIAARSLAMKGGALGEDRLALDKVDLVFNVVRDGEKITIDKFAFTSPLAQASASGSLLPPPAGAKYPDGRVQFEAHVNLAAVAGQLPHTLKLRKGQSVTGGTFDLVAKVDAAPKALRIEAAMGLKDLAAVMDGRNVGLDRPVTLAVVARMDEKGPALDKLLLESSFASLNGAGSLEKMDMGGTVDLAAALAEAKKFVDIPGLQAAGKLSLKAGLASSSETRKQVSLAVTVSDLRVVKEGLGPVAEKQVDLQAQAALLMDPSRGLQGLSDAALSLRTSFLDVQATRVKVGLPSAGGALTADAGLQVKCDLGQAFEAAARAVTNLPAGMKVGGRLDLACGVAVKGDPIRVSGLDLKVADLSLVMPGPPGAKARQLAEKELRLKGGIEADPKRRSASVDDLSLTFTPGSLKVARLTVADWAKLPGGVKASVEGQVDVAQLLAWLDGFAALPEGTTIEGGGKIKLELETEEDKQKASLEAGVTNLKIASAKQPPVKEDRIQLTAALTVEPKPGNVEIRNFALASTPLALNMTGRFDDWTRSRRVDVKGDLTCDFARIAELAAPFAGRRLDMAGKKSEPFTIRTSLQGNDWKDILKGTDMAAGIYLERAQMFGIQVANVKVPIRAGKGQARADVDATVNEGKVTASPILDVTGARPTLKLPDNQKLISQVRLNESIANDLLAYLHPVFRGAAATAGRLTLEMNRLNVPLDESLKKDAAFEGKVTLSGLQLGAAGIIKDVMSLTGMSRFDVVPGDQEFGFRCEKGRIYTDPITVRSGDAQWKFSGSVGLDQTLDYGVDVPITRGMVGANVYDYVKGETIRVPIGGTVTSPSLGKDVFAKVLGDVVSKAGKKAATRVLEKEAGKLLKGLFR